MDTSFYFEYYVADSSTLIFLKDTFRRIDSKRYFSKNDDIIISKYANTMKDSALDVTHIFYSSEYGIISTFRNAYFRLDYIEYDKLTWLKDDFINDLTILFGYDEQ